MMLLFFFLPFLFSTELKEVLDFALKNAPQFQEVGYLTSSKIAALDSVFSAYDTVLSSRYESDPKFTEDSYRTSISKNLGYGVSISGSHEKTISPIGTNPDSYTTGVSLDIKLLKDLLGSASKQDLLIRNQNQELLELSLEKAKQNLVFGIIKAYLDTKRAEDMLKEQNLLLENIEQLYDATKTKHEIGISEEKDLLQVEANKKNFELSLIDLNRTLEFSYNTLSSLTGKRFKDLNWPKLKIATKSNNLELKELELSRKNLLAEKDKETLLPDLSFNYSYGKERKEYGSTLAFTLSIPLENRLTRSRLKSLNFSLLENEIKTEISNTKYSVTEKEHLRAINDYQKEISLAKDIFDLTNKRFDLELEAYEQGRISIYDMVAVENDLVNANITLIDKNYLYDLNMASYLLHQGEL